MTVGGEEDREGKERVDMLINLYNEKMAHVV